MTQETKTTERFSGSVTLPDPIGLGLRGPHYRDIDEQKPDIGWLEVHPENYFGGGIHRYYLEKLRQDYEVSFHAVGISLGSAHGLDNTHLKKIKELIDIFEPFQISDHASWSASGNAHLNDLLPLPYTQETLETLCTNIDKVQHVFGRNILVENPSTYMAFSTNEMEEYELMNALAERTGCGILLDCNNIFVQAHNHNFDPFHYISQINPAFVGEMHLAGHSERDLGEETILIDTHSKPVKKDVWDLYAHAINHLGETPTLIEWDADIPPLQVLLDEAEKARKILNTSLSLEGEDRNSLSDSEIEFLGEGEKRAAKKDLKPLVQNLRKQQTNAEKKLWQELRGRKLGGFKFRRQAPVPPYIADFICYEQKLIIELDGWSHDGKQKEDHARDNYLKQEDFQILRFANEELDRNLDGVLQTILNTLNTPSPRSSNMLTHKDNLSSPLRERKTKPLPPEGEGRLSQQAQRVNDPLEEEDMPKIKSRHIEGVRT